MAKYARGKKSYAISDRSGLRVRYSKLKTTWDGLRVSPEDWEPKHPQLTPAKNVVDATALFNGRPDTDPENAKIFIGFTQDWTIDPRLLPPIGVLGYGGTGFISLDLSSDPDVTGVGGTGGVGAELIELTLAETGVGGTGAVAGTSEDAYLQYSIAVQSTADGNRYYVDSVIQQQLYLQEGQTYRFDQSNSSNSGHPLRFSTTSNGTHAGGSEYTTGVVTSGTPGSAGAYTQITVASGAPTLYYYCTNHNYMGGTSYTPASGTISLAITVQAIAAGNRYYIDGGGPALVISLTEGTTYRFDQSNSSNNNHPLRFSTTSGGSHSGGSEYTTGVTTSGTPGNSGAYTQIAVASGAPTLYYYCTNHNYMGNQLNTPAITAASSGVTVELIQNATGLAGDGEVGNEAIVGNPPINAGAAGAGAVGAEALILTIAETGVAGTGAVGNESISISEAGWGGGDWGEGTWGN